MSILLKVAIGVFGAYIVGGVVDKKLFPIVEVEGCSMEPTYKSGDVFLSRKVFDHQILNTGDVVVLLNPREKDSGHKFLIKRISAFQFREGLKRWVFVLGDNSGNSLDSREFGWVPISNVKYKAVKPRPLEK